MKHPYSEFNATALWREIDRTITALEANRDLQVTTARSHVIGLLCKRLVEADLILEAAILRK